MVAVLAGVLVALADPVVDVVPPALVVVDGVLAPAAPVAPAVVAPALVVPALVAPGFAVAPAPASVVAFAVPVAVVDFVSVPGFVPASCANVGSAVVNPASSNTQQAL